jgi:hypothetical protein
MENQNNISFDDFDPKNLQQDIDTLVANRNTPLSDLEKNPKLKNIYHSFKSSSDMLFNTDCYPQIWKMVENSKKRIGKCDVQPETVGSFLFGCGLDNYGDVKSKDDSPFCVNSMKKNNRFDFKNFIFVKTDDELKLFSRPDNKKDKKVKVLVFFKNDSKTLDANDVNEIRRLTDNWKVNKVLFYDLSTHKLINKFNSVDKIPIIVFNPDQNEVTKNENINSKSLFRRNPNNNNRSAPRQIPNNKKSSRGITISTGALIWLVIIIVVIVLIIGGIGAMQRKKITI